MQYIRDLFGKQYTALMADVHIDWFDAYHYAPKTKHWDSVLTNT